MQTLVLGSSSPRRRELLAQLDLSFSVQSVDIDETPYADEAALRYVERMALQKAEALVRERVSASPREGNGCYVLTADTIGELDGKVLVKPGDRDDFEQMMRAMSGRTHQVSTSVCVLVCDANGRVSAQRLRTVTTEVTFKSLTDHDIDSYWATGEPLDKAGGYGIQSKGALLVAGIHGSYSNVVGLPLMETAEMLQELGLDVWTAMQT